MNYKVFIQSIEPEGMVAGDWWINNASGQVFIFYSTWTLVCGGGAFTITTEGAYNKTSETQATEGTRTPGQIWINSANHTAQIFVDDWVQYAGG